MRVFSSAHELRNEVVEELSPDLVGESGTELVALLIAGGRNRGMKSEKGRRGEEQGNSREKKP